MDRRAESPLVRRVAESYAAAGLSPPAPARLAAELGVKRQIVDGVVRHLVGDGRLCRLRDGLVIAAAALDDLAAELAATGWERFSVGQFKQRFGISSRWAIPLLEQLDAAGATRRDGESRRLLRKTVAPLPP